MLILAVMLPFAVDGQRVLQPAVDRQIHLQVAGEADREVFEVGAHPAAEAVLFWQEHPILPLKVNLK